MSIVNRYVQLLLLLTIAVTVASVVLWARVAEGVASLGGWLLEWAGLAWPVILLWVLALMLALRFQRFGVLKRWPRWLGALALVGVATGAASFFTVPWERFYDLNLGGALGGAIAGKSVWLASLRLTLLALIGFAGVGPGIAAGLARASGAHTVGAARNANLIGRVISAPFRMLGALASRRREKAPRPSAALPLASVDAEELSGPGGWETLRKPDFGPVGPGESRAGPSSFTREPRQPVRGTGAPPEMPHEAPKERPRFVTPAPAAPAFQPGAWQPVASVQQPPIQAPDEVTIAEPAVREETPSGVEEHLLYEDEFEATPWRSPAPPAQAGGGVARSSLPGNEGRVAPVKSSGDGWKLPPSGMLRLGAEEPVDEVGNRERAELIGQTLADYGIEVEVSQTRPGPVVTMFGLTPGWVRRSRQQALRDDNGDPVRDERGRAVTRMVEERTRVKVDAILARENDLALALACPNLRFEAPVPGENIVGIEVPNPRQSVVTLRSVMMAEEFSRHSGRSRLAFALGRGPGGAAEAADLGSMPHLLVAGSTGSGKSVFLNSVILSLIYQCTPLELRLLLIDPKRVELTPLNGLPHLLEPVVVEPELVVRHLKGLLREMTKRYKQMEALGVRNIQGHNAAVEERDRMPFIVVCLDELADLMMVAPQDTEQAICRLAQLGRAAGIHLIVATQRPSVNVVTGLIKANFPARISFNVVSQVDSRTILDAVGAERLLGRGDMLFLPPESSKPRRIQGTYVSDDEIQAVLKFWQSQPCPPPPAIDLSAPPSSEERGVAGGHDDMFVQALKVARTQRTLSTSFLQRKLRIGYPRASRLKEELEDEGVVGPTGEVSSTIVDDLLMSLEDEG